MLDLFAESNPDSPEELRKQALAAQAVLDDPKATSWDKGQARTKRDSAQSRQRTKKMLDAKDNRDRPPNVNDYGRLLERAVDLFDNDAAEGKLYLHNTLLKYGCDSETLKGFTWSAYTETANHLIEMEVAVKRAGKKRKKPMKTEVAETMLYQAICKDAEAAGITRSEVFAHWGPIKTEHGENEEALLILDKKIKALIAGKDSVTENLFDESEDLFSDAIVDSDGVTVTTTGEVITKTEELNKQELCEQAREDLGIRDVFEIKSKEQLQRLQRERLMLMLELAWITQQYQEIKHGLETSLQDWDNKYRGACEQYLKDNPPAEGQTIKTLYGKIWTRAQGESISLRDDIDDQQKQAWIHLQYKNGKKDEYGIEQYASYKFDLEKVKKGFSTELEQYRIARAKGPAEMPTHPILQYKPAGKIFIVSPSIDTMLEEVKKGTWKQEKYIPTSQS